MPLYRMQQVFVDVAREGLNMDRMRDIVDRRMQKMLNALESSPHQTFCESLIWFFLYGDSQVCVGGKLCIGSLVVVHSVKMVLQLITGVVHLFGHSQS